MLETVFRPRMLAFYVVPVACLAIALYVHITGFEIVDAPMALRLTVGALAMSLVLATVFIALHHAEAIAHRIGEPWGTLVLTFAVTSLEVSIIVSMMLHGENNPTLARESVFSTVMIICGGVVGACLALGGWRHNTQDIKRQGTSAFLAVLIALTVLTMVLPNYTLTTGHGTFSAMQLFFVSVLSVVLYGSFVFAQAVGQKEDFILESAMEREERQHPQGSAPIGLHFLFLFIGLAGIILLTEQIAAGVEEGLKHFEIAQSDSIVGAMIALIVLLPEAMAAIRASLANDLQRGLNIALGSACATIGLTIPAVAVASMITGRSLTLGLSEGDTVLLVLALMISIVSFGTGRTTLLTGFAHLVVFLAYVLLIFAP